MSQALLRQQIIQEAITWLKTPWHHAACVKGAGVDCVGLLRGVYNAVGLIRMSDAEMPDYPQDIMLHRNEETVLDVLSSYAQEITAPLPGDVVVWKFGRIFSHAGIVIEWPRVIHAHHMDKMVIIGDAMQGDLAGRETKFFTMIGIK